MSQPKILMKPPQGRGPFFVSAEDYVPEPRYLENELAHYMRYLYREGLDVESITLTAKNWEAFGIDKYYESEFTIEAALGPVTFRKGTR